MGNWKAFIPIILAIVIAIGGSIFMYRWLQNKTIDQKVVQAKGDTISIVVAAADLAKGTKLKGEMIKVVPYLKESLPNGIQSDPKSLEGRVLIASLKQKEPVLEYKLAPKEINIGGVSSVIQQGKRAVAVKGDKVIGVSGFVQPGNCVDVLVTMRDPKTKADSTKLVLDNILILATGTEINENQDGKPAPVDIYTLEVDPEQAEKLALAQAKGKLQFALRNLTDTAKVLTKGATITSTLTSLQNDTQKPAASPTNKWEPTYRTIEVIKGDKISKEKFRL